MQERILEAMKEIIAGRLDFFFAPIGNALPHVKDGALAALVVNSAKRSAAMPDVPTTAEAGFVDAEYPFWIGMFLPAKTPRPIVDKLHGEVVKALEAPSVRARPVGLGVDTVTMAPGEMDAFIREQITVDAALAKAAGVTPQ
jgi:tripartite-type tricarboxylate transporter receptor subunit TctC